MFLGIYNRKKVKSQVGGYDEKYKYAMDIDLMLKLIRLSLLRSPPIKCSCISGGYGVSQSHFVSALLEWHLLK